MPPGFRFGDPRVMALLSAIVGFAHFFVGSDNPTLTRLVHTILNRPYCSRQATYDLRWPRRKGLIERVPGTSRYLVTPYGRRLAVQFTKAHSRVLAPGLAWFELACPMTWPSGARSLRRGGSSTALWALSMEDATIAA